jgi:hypothetical protein
LESGCRWLVWLGCLLAVAGILLRMGHEFGQLRLGPRPATAITSGPIRRGRKTDGPECDEPTGSYSRYSSDLQSPESNADQQRQCRDKALLNGHRVSSKLEFSDEAISGTKRHRAGLDALLATAEAGRIKVLYFHSLSRLSRESVIRLPLLKNLVYNCGVRIISVTEGIDSNNTGSELIAHVMCIVHEQYLKDLAANVFRGQEGAVLAGFSAADMQFLMQTFPHLPCDDEHRLRSCSAIRSMPIAWR